MEAIAIVIAFILVIGLVFGALIIVFIALTLKEVDLYGIGYSTEEISVKIRDVLFIDGDTTILNDEVFDLDNYSIMVTGSFFADYSYSHGDIFTPESYDLVGIQSDIKRILILTDDDEMLIPINELYEIENLINSIK